MPAASSLLPWFAPRLSRPMIGVLNNLGHEMHYTRTRSLYRLVDRGLFAEVVKHFMYKIEWWVGIGA